ncbi:N-acyl-D-amino-acid deacylase [Rhodococcus sp. W8901]|uniref:N-acyl-D-amino-acid deacylase n=1 Tax=Rhodococcus sp. W8901 TaxID=2742603 RepID=UPI0015830D78|nr:N-acyl-D-amino-acid deacylase [Rhodococcus sp. W8901]QKT12734.1 N-acyl-D-amino-acid deacylase [Rhodococcus sp. W8901]
MADVVAIDVAGVRATAQALQAGAELLTGVSRTVSECGFGSSDAGTTDTAREQAVRDGYARLARAIGAWAAGSADDASALRGTSDAYERQESANVVALGGR